MKHSNLISRYNQSHSTQVFFIESTCRTHTSEKVRSKIIDAPNFGNFKFFLS